jgi:hypothetical protein
MANEEERPQTVAAVDGLGRPGAQSYRDAYFGTTLQGRNGPFSFERGIDIRLDAIEWVSDAPYGS